ncbi:MAG: class I SAM-dependent methyltransferase [Actinomycetota bacterium]
MAADPNLTTTPAALHLQPGFSFRQALVRQWRDGVRHYGLWRTLKEEIEALLRCARESLPDRREARYGDMDYDRENMVDTTRANVPFRTQLAIALTGHAYYASEPYLFEQIMQALPIDFSRFSFIDLGSGKGRALMMAAGCGFRQAIGVEYIPALHRVAQQNIRKFAREHRDLKTQMESLCMDARDFEFPAEPLVLYLFNPFSEPVFAAVLDRLQRSITGSQRPVYIAYRYLEFEPLLARCDWLEKIAGTEQWAVYRIHRDHAAIPAIT